MESIQRKEYPLSVRCHVVAMREALFSYEKISERTGVSKRQCQRIWAEAKRRGYHPGESIFQDSFFVDKPRIGRPKKVTPEVEEELLATVRKSRKSRAFSAVQLACILRTARLSGTTITRILKRAGFRKVKPTRKPGLTPEQKRKRLEFALKYKDWTLEDWKKVVWSDETSVIRGHRRGNQRVWRQPKEQYDKTVIRPRWKGFSEFMWWSCYSYNFKGPYFIWYTETKAEKEAAEKDLEERNRVLEPIKMAEWELSNTLRRTYLNRKAKGRAPKWKWNEANGKLVRKAERGGIDWYRYAEEILKKRLLPFAQDYNLVVQEDGAAPHIHQAHVQLFEKAKIEKLIWPPNSPDLNMIEPNWGYMKREASAHWDFEKKNALEGIFVQVWEELEQDRIRMWIERIPRHIQEVIRLEGGNEYREGANDKQRRFIRKVRRTRFAVGARRELDNWVDVVQSDSE